MIKIGDFGEDRVEHKEYLMSQLSSQDPTNNAVGTLETFENGKSPGEDGFTDEFYKQFGSIFVPGQPTSVRLHRARHPSRARSKIELGISSSIVRKRTRIESSSKSVYRARLAIELKVAFRARSTNRARKVIELSKVGNSDFFGGTSASNRARYLIDLGSQSAKYRARFYILYL